MSRSLRIASFQRAGGRIDPSQGARDAAAQHGWNLLPLFVRSYIAKPAGQTGLTLNGHVAEW